MKRGKKFVLDATSNDRPVSSSGPLTVRERSATNVVVQMLQRGQPVSGRALDELGQPLAGVPIRLHASADLAGYTSEQRESLSFGINSNRTTKTSSNGVFVFRRVPSGKILLTTGRDGKSAKIETVV